MDILSEPPHLSVGRLLFIKPESLFNEITDWFSGRWNFLRLEMRAEKIKPSFGFSTDAVRCTLSLVNRHFSLPIAFTALLFSSFFRGLLPELLIRSTAPNPDF